MASRLIWFTAKPVSIHEFKGRKSDTKCFFKSFDSVDVFFRPVLQSASQQFPQMIRSSCVSMSYHSRAQPVQVGCLQSGQRNCA